MIKQECIGIPDMILLLMIFCFKKIKIKAEIVLSPGGAYFSRKCARLLQWVVFFRHERSTFCSFVQQPPQLQISTTPTSEASKAKRKNKTDVHNLEITLRIPTFFRNYATFWNFLDWNFFPKGSPLQFFLMFCNTMDVKKSQMVPPFTFFGTVTLFKNLI